MNITKPHLIITGTHLTPALAVIDKLKSSYRLTYLGKLSLKLDIPTQSLIAPKLHRHNLTSAISLPAKLPIAIFKARLILKRLKPDLILSFGGYLALPVCLAAKTLKIPIIIHEQTFKAGLVNKLTANLATKIALSWPDSQRYFPKSKTVLTGNPVRQELLNLKPQAKTTPTIYITGGNQGSKVINQTITQILPQLLKTFTVIHQFGLGQADSLWTTQKNLKKVLPSNLQSKYRLKKWFEVQELTNIYPKASLVISRSGANTITELGLLHKPSVLIPLPYSQKNEQLINAQYLAKLGLAVIIPQSKLTPSLLLKTIQKPLKHLTQKSNQTFPTKLVKSASKNLVQLINQTLSDTKKTQT